jgi:hypothetical protein
VDFNWLPIPSPANCPRDPRDSVRRQARPRDGESSEQRRKRRKEQGGSSSSRPVVRTRSGRGQSVGTVRPSVPDHGRSQRRGMIWRLNAGNGGWMPGRGDGVGMGTCVRACAGSPVDSAGKWSARGGRIGRASRLLLSLAGNQ